MKIRATLLALSSLLLLGTLASAGTADQAGGTEPAADLSFLAAPAQAGCPATEIPSFAPAPTPAAFPCGSCSESVCVGRALHTTCGVIGGHIAKCEAVYGNLCSGESAWECLCWSGPLP